MNRILFDEAAIGWYSSAPWNYTSGKVGEGCGFGVEGGNGFDEAGDGECVADAALGGIQGYPYVGPAEDLKLK